MEDANTSLLLKRPVNLKVIVTTRWKEEMQQQLQAQIEQVDNQIQQIEMQGQRAIAEIQKQRSLLDLKPSSSRNEYQLSAILSMYFIREPFDPSNVWLLSAIYSRLSQVATKSS